MHLFDPEGDEDGDTYTNEEELNEGTDPEDPLDKPIDITAPVVHLNGSETIDLLLSGSYLES